MDSNKNSAVMHYHLLMLLFLGYSCSLLKHTILKWMLKQRKNISTYV